MEANSKLAHDSIYSSSIYSIDTKLSQIVLRIMDYDPRDYYDEIEAQFADEMEAMDEMEKFQREPENAEPPGYM